MARSATATVSARFVFTVLRLAAAADAPLSVAEISRRLGVSVNKAYRAALTLESAGYLRRNPDTARFEIGPAAERLVYAAFAQFHIRAALAPYLRQIATSAQATTSLVVPVGWYGLTLALVEGGSNVVSRARRLGRASLLNESPAGRVMLALLTASEVARFRAFAASYSARSAPAAVEADDAHLAAIRAAGFDSVAPRTGQFNAIGMPLRDRDERPIAAIAIEAPPGRHVPLKADPLLADWLGMAAQAETLVRNNPEPYANPYALLDPDTIDFSGS